MAIKNILTVDVEDWYHICDIEHILPSSQWSRCESRVLANLEKILTLFNRFNVKATFFVLGYLAERTPEVVKIIHEEGHEVASHGYGHLQIYKQREDEFLRDLLQSKTLIEGIIGKRVVGYRAPEWSMCK
ncbi:MAG TPA: polysaccharide deacetylase family protein, partial [Thermodesulfobacteriota bacterium]|nr:polysaccharide deacetylase family protein [Thermodesulfobacteriota bacterium]